MVALPVLFPVFGSNCAAPVIVAVFVPTAGVDTRALMTSVTEAPLATLGIAQTPVAGTKVPRLAVADTNVRPGVRTSRTTTLVATSGPRLVRVTVYVTTSPTF